MQIRSYTELENLIKALAGIFSFTDEEKTQVESFVNRRAFEAYNISPVWPRYLVSSEERAITTANLIPYEQTDPAKDPIGEFIRIHRKQAFLNNSTLEFDFYVDANLLTLQVMLVKLHLKDTDYIQVVHILLVKLLWK